MQRNIIPTIIHVKSQHELKNTNINVLQKNNSNY